MTEDEQKLLQQLLDDESDRLTKWEIIFIDNLSHKFYECDKNLTEKQIQTLHSIGKALRYE